MSNDGNNKWGGDATVLAGAMEAVETFGAAQVATAAPAPIAPTVPSRAPARWTRSPNVVDRPTLLGVMVLPAEGAAVVLTGVAADVWRALARPTPGDQLVERIAAGPAGPAEVAGALRYLRAMGAVREMR